MAVTRLQDDLLHEFGEEKRFIVSQSELLDPLAASLRSNAAYRLANKSMIFFAELICWLLLLATIAVMIFLNKLYPFYLISELSRPEHTQTMGLHNVQMLKWSFYIMLGSIGLLCYLLARALARVRKKNDILSMTGARIKKIVVEHHKRKLAVDALEQRHLGELPPETPIIITDVNEVRNPGYDYPGDPLVR